MQAAAQRFGIPQASGDPAEVFDNAAIDAIAICSSTETHADFIIEAARAGKHVFCEKPIALNLGAVDAALAAVAASGVKLQIGFNRRFDANFRGVRDAVRKGEVGTPYLVQFTSRDPEPPPLSYIERSGGIFLDMMIHDFDMARFLLDDEIDEVSASGAVRVDPAIGEAGDIDTAVVALRFRSGALGVITNSRQAVYGYDQKVEVLGSLGSVSCENNTPDRIIRQTGRRRDPFQAPLFFPRTLSGRLRRRIALLHPRRSRGQPGRGDGEGRTGRRSSWRWPRGLSLREKRSVAVSEISDQ